MESARLFLNDPALMIVMVVHSRYAFLIKNASRRAAWTDITRGKARRPSRRNRFPHDVDFDHQNRRLVKPAGETQPA